jgi:hypothetical protein
MLTYRIVKVLNLIKQKYNNNSKNINGMIPTFTLSMSPTSQAIKRGVLFLLSRQSTSLPLLTHK